ncbi:PREDICTED: protein PFC0760c-like [Wasmannia auropunctata]|uniref:protein PFC0760c-like n=1 Tax=Wasmannia auropunctata TaxID=64793 RepID=UPI0005EF9EDF|nr:PREDICTED: protein PFC0760c-like [Wasmannia auropunctata]
MYGKITLCLLSLLAIARSKEVSTAKNVETANFMNSRLTTILPYSSLYNDEHLIKDNKKRSFVLLMPVSETRNKHKKSKETVKKTKRCDEQHKKNKFLLSTKEDSNRVRTTDKNINVGISKQNSNDHTKKNKKYSRKNSATSKRMATETYEDKMLLRAFKNNLNEEDMNINLKSKEKAKKCNTEKYICHCEEEKCSSSSSKKSSSKMLGSSKTDDSGRRRPIKYDNAKLDISQQKSPILYHENPYKLLLPNLIDYFSIQPYSEKINNIPHVPILYEITPYMVENEKNIDVGIPFTSFEDRQNYLNKPNHLVGNNQYQPIIHKKPCICSPIDDQVESSISITSPSTNYVDETTAIKETTNDLESNNPINTTEKNQEHFPKLSTEVPNIEAPADSETKTNLHLNYSNDVTEESNTIGSSNLNKVMHKSEDFTEQTEKNSDNLSKLTTHSADYLDISSTPSVIYDKTNDGKFINIEECIQLFGRDVCVLSATSPRMFAKQAQKNNPNKYSMIRIPEYVTQMSTRKETTLNTNSDKFKATDPYFAMESPTNKINKSNVNLNKHLESTSIKSTDIDKASSKFNQYPESVEQISEPDINYDENKSFSSVKNAHNPIKKLINPINDEIAKTKKNKLLGKSKSHTTKLLLNPNDKEIPNSTSSQKFLYSTPLYKSSNDEDANNWKINQQNQVPTINFNSNISDKEKTTVTSYDPKIDSEKQNRNHLKETNTNIYSEKKIPQKHFKEETTTSSNFKTSNNFTEEKNTEIIGINVSTQPGDIFQEESTTMQYFDDKKSSNLNNKESTTNNLKTFIDSSANRLPFCDNTLLLNSIRKVINDFTLDTRVSKTKDLNENILQTQGKNLLPEILQVPNLKNILSVPQIENTIVEKVKDVLSYVTAIPRKDFTNDWSHGIIKNTLRSILDGFSGFHHKLPPNILEEHQFKNGQWGTNLVTLAPISDQKSRARSENLRESIKDLLSSPAIASQTNQEIVRNIIVQSVKNSLINDKDDKIDDTIIYALNDIIQMFKNSEDTNTLEKSNEVISDKKNMDVAYMQEMPTSNYEIEINVDNSTLNSKQNLDVKKDIKLDDKKIQTTDYQKAKTLENDANILTTSEFPYLLKLYEEKEEETTNKSNVKEDIKDQILNKIKKIDEQNDAEKKVAESLKPKITYHKAILQNNPNVLITSEPNSTGAEQYIKNHQIDKEKVKETTTITNFMQETSSDYGQISDDKILESTLGTKDIEGEVKHIFNENILTTTTDKIDPLIILERIKFNLPPTKYYSPEILKYATNRIDDENVEITTAAANFIQETSSNYAQDGIILQNIAETKDRNEMETKNPLTATSGNLISSTNVEYKDYKPKIILLTDKNISNTQNFTEDNIIKIHEVTTEIERTYAKTTYFKAGSSNNDNSRISSPSLTYETMNIHINNDNANNNSNSDNDNNNLIGNKMNINTDNIIKTKEVAVSSSKPSAIDDNYPSELFPSSVVSDDISELQRSQLYYISDGVKLPLEIKRLEDGSYALSISKNICEQILSRKCPCCVPLQGYIVRSLNDDQQENIHATTSTIIEKKENMYVNNFEKDYQPIQPSSNSITITRRNTLKTQNSKEEEEQEKKERINACHLWKQNNNNLATIPMPVVDFAKKYNLLLDFTEEGLLNRAGLQNKTQNYNKSVMKSEEGFEHQSEQKNINNYHDIEKNRLLDENNDAINKFQFEVQKANAQMNQSERNQELKREIKTANDVQNINIVQEVNSENNEKNSLLKEINISEDSKISKEKIKLNKLLDIEKGNTVFHRNENRDQHEAAELIDDYNVPEVKNFKENIGKPYRYQRNTNGVANKRTEIVKSMLYWLKGLFVDK